MKINDGILREYFLKYLVTDSVFWWWKKHLTRTERKEIINPYKKERAEQELNLNLKYQFSINTEKDFNNFIWFLYGGEFKKVFAELQK